MNEGQFLNLLKTSMKLFQALVITRLNCIMNKLLKISTKNHLNHAPIVQGLFFLIVLKFILKVVIKLMVNLQMLVYQAHQIKSLHLLRGQKLYCATFVGESMEQHLLTFI